MLKFGHPWARVGVQPLQNASTWGLAGSTGWPGYIPLPAPPHSTALKSHFLFLFLCFLILQASWPGLEDQELVAWLRASRRAGSLSGLGFPCIHVDPHTRPPAEVAPVATGA